jgi:hypothetical protein
MSAAALPATAASVVPLGDRAVARLGSGAMRTTGEGLEEHVRAAGLTLAAEQLAELDVLA